MKHRHAVYDVTVAAGTWSGKLTNHQCSNDVNFYQLASKLSAWQAKRPRVTVADLWVGAGGKCSSANTKPVPVAIRHRMKHRLLCFEGIPVASRSACVALQSASLVGLPCLKINRNRTVMRVFQSRLLVFTLRVHALQRECSGSRCFSKEVCGRNGQNSRPPAAAYPLSRDRASVSWTRLRGYCWRVRENATENL